MKKTEKDLLEFLGLKIGCVIRTCYNNYSYRVTEVNNGIQLVSTQEGYVCYKNLRDLIDCEFEIVSSGKTKGDLLCSSFGFCCKDCPLTCIGCSANSSGTLYEILDKTIQDYPILEPMKKPLMKELNKQI